MFTIVLVIKNVKVTEENHLDLFDKDRLVYLSPDSRNDLKRVGTCHIFCNFEVQCSVNIYQVSDDDIYVIGALINKTETDRGPLTLAQAKRLKIRHARCLSPVLLVFHFCKISPL